MKTKSFFITFLAFFCFVSCSTDSIEDDQIDSNLALQDLNIVNSNEVTPKNCYYLAAVVEGATCFNAGVPARLYSVYATSGGNIVNYNRLVETVIITYKKDRNGNVTYLDIIDGGSVVIPAGQNTSNNRSVFPSYRFTKKIGKVEVRVASVINMSTGEFENESSSSCSFYKTTYNVDNCFQPVQQGNPGIEITPCNGAIGVGPDDNNDCMD